MAHSFYRHEPGPSRASAVTKVVYSICVVRPEAGEDQRIGQVCCWVYIGTPVLAQRVTDSDPRRAKSTDDYMRPCGRQEVGRQIVVTLMTGYRRFGGGENISPLVCAPPTRRRG